MKAKQKGGAKKVLINPSWCKGCGICVELCPKGALDLGPDGYALWARPRDCAACGSCQMRCPDLAVELVEGE